MLIASVFPPLWSLKPLKLSLPKPKSLFPALLLIFLSLSVTGCVSESVKLMPPLPVPDVLFTPCRAPEFTGTQYGDLPLYVVELLGVIEVCNGQLAGIKAVTDEY